MNKKYLEYLKKFSILKNQKELNRKTPTGLLKLALPEKPKKKGSVKKKKSISKKIFCYANNCLICGRFVHNRQLCQTHTIANKGRERTRELVRMRDKHTCQSCGKKWEKGQRRFDVHHLNGLCGKRSRKYDRVSDMDILITLCHKCHFNRPDHPWNKKIAPSEATKIA